MTDDSSPQRILLVTGLLGAGKTTALRTLEDVGWEAIDNFPIRLLDRLLETEPGSARMESSGPMTIGFDTRTRGFDPTRTIDLVKKLSQRKDLQVTTLFLDCAGAELERRYNETRRRHPMSEDKPAATGIMAERELLEPLRRWADVVITTTSFTSNDLQAAIRAQFGSETPSQPTLTISSFGFSRGTPPLADLVFDMRFLANPHWVDALRPQTGQDVAVGAYIREDPAFADAFARIRDLLLLLLPRYQEQGKAYVHVAFGCTGGKHRSVFMAEQIASALRTAGFSPTLLHRNLASRAADLLEGQKL
ncbi:MAG: RNase adaptor protein RapZ [Novosphingobium sp. 17-62-19]|uniref:RNase adapter RapZ n=1 Tax=Novosphingobium sp. 17-62-19 TaxID=1970406 RepID=UPI000BD3B7BD|nr:RNase adapter RapZ [Novosphingobium sp. 17-62-19]OYX95893.1 MAG: RNase adaptor protein RapZ [Novosphingobium sp. 35-62-5]OZA20450.1 MAG: RNase adaptor protein RapZ [Novosphingobium sp. 17-62-19]HQS95551.1 RNase adapter RapZ [Novosphingobium sp.]